MHISTQMSLYPLRQPRLSPAVETVWKALEKNQLDFKKGRMSTVISGEAEVVFGAPFMSMFILIAVFDHYLKKHLWSHIIKSHA